MTEKLQRWQAVLLMVLIGFLWWIAMTSSAGADPRLESRINRLESNLGRLSTQVSRIEAQLTQTDRSPSPPRGSPPSATIAPYSDDQFDNLATLAVETKLQLRQLEARVALLEANGR